MPPAIRGNALVRAYDTVANSLDRVALHFERRMARDADPSAFGAGYAQAAAPTMKWMAWLTANVRVEAIFVACLLGDPRLFWGFEIVVLSGIAAVTIARHRAVERACAGNVHPSRPTNGLAGIITKEQGHR